MNVKRNAYTWLASMALLLSACAHPAGPGGLAARSPGGALQSRATDLIPPRFSLPSATINEVDVLYDMATFEAMEQLIARARQSIQIDYYIFGGPTAQRLADLIVARHQTGVQVSVLLDAKFGTIPEMTAQTKPVYQKLKDAGVAIAIHAERPLPPLTSGRTIDHNKYMVVDEAEALVGSMNLAKKFYQYHDLMLHVRGPVAKDLAAQHRFDWYYATHPKAPLPQAQIGALEPVNMLPPTEGARVRLIGTGLGRKTGLDSLLPLLNGAKESIHVQMHELGPGPALDALCAARDRGVDVKILLDPGIVDPFVPVIHKAPRGVVNAVALDLLLARKMTVRHYRVDEQITTAHMKSAVIDGRILYAGSLNWTRGGFEAVAETNLEVVGGRAPGQAEATFQQDWQTRSSPAEPPSALALFLCRTYQGLP